MLRTSGVVRSVLACVVVVLLVGCSSLTGSRPAATASAAPATARAASPDYVIGPGDRLAIFVYESPQLSVADIPVRPDGRLSVPLVNDMVAAGKTPSQLATDIAASLKEYVKDPNVSVMVHDFVGPFDRQVRVIGEAADPQAIPYRDHMTVLDVMIITKGLTKFAAGNRAVIERSIGGQRETIHVRLADLMKDGDIDQNVEMKPGDTLIIPQTWF
jgi:polysaccharide export outer membrane protein